MAHREKTVWQFKVTLQDIRPQIWRRIQVPSAYSFWDLHVAIQDAFGWLDCHLHEFRIQRPDSNQPIRIGIPDDSPFEGDELALPGWEIALGDYLSSESPSAEYIYDFGDDWRHAVRLEKALPADPGDRYPICIGGARHCPPEDVGGPFGYLEFLQAIGNPDHPAHESYLEWVGEAFDPEAFDPAEVRFDNPKKRWKRAFEQGR